MCWPELGDCDADIDAFVEDFEEAAGLANGGRGVPAAEKIRCIGACLRGSRAQMYLVKVRAARRHGPLKTEPEDVYQRILGESSLEKNSCV